MTTYQLTTFSSKQFFALFFDNKYGFRSYIFQLNSMPGAPENKPIKSGGFADVLNVTLLDSNSKTFELSVWAEKAHDLYKVVSNEHSVSTVFWYNYYCCF